VSAAQEVPGRPEREPADAAAAVLAMLDPEVLERLIDQVGSRGELVEQMATQIVALQVRLAARRVSVPSWRAEHLAAATLSDAPGVQQNVEHAAQRYAKITADPDLPVEVAVLVGRAHDAETVTLMGRTYRGLAEVAAQRPAEPRIFQRMVVAALAAAGVPDVGRRACAVLDRGAAFAAGHRAVGGEVPPMPVFGSADFLVAVAGYRVALDEAGGRSVVEPVAEVGAALPELARLLRLGLTRPSRELDRGGVDEPDSAWFLEQIAEYLGGHSARRCVTALDRGLRRARWRPQPSTALDPRTRRAVGVVEVEPSEPNVTELAGRIVASLVRAPAAAAAAAWLRGVRPVDEQDDLDELLNGIWRLRAELATRPVDDDPGPVDPALVAVVEARLGDGVVGPVRRLTAALPPLWSRRDPAIRLLTAHLRAAGNRPPVARLVAAVVACGPGQAAVAGDVAAHEPGTACVRSEESGRCVARTDAAALPPALVCPARPWPEDGLVESHRTLAQRDGRDDAGSAARTWRTYNGPWADVVWLVSSRV